MSGPGLEGFPTACFETSNVFSVVILPKQSCYGLVQ